MYAFLGCYLAIQPLLKSLPGNLQHFMSEQIDLHVFKAITAASCVDIIVNKR